MKCEMQNCSNRVRFKLSTDNGTVTLLCGKHLVKTVRALRRLISQGTVTVFLQRFTG